MNSISIWDPEPKTQAPPGLPLDVGTKHVGMQEKQRQNHAFMYVWCRHGIFLRQSRVFPKRSAETGIGLLELVAYGYGWNREKLNWSFTATRLPGARNYLLRIGAC